MLENTLLSACTSFCSSIYTDWQLAYFQGFAVVSGAAENILMCVSRCPQARSPPLGIHLGMKCLWKRTWGENVKLCPKVITLLNTPYPQAMDKKSCGPLLSTSALVSRLMRTISSVHQPGSPSHREGRWGSFPKGTRICLPLSGGNTAWWHLMHQKIPHAMQTRDFQLVWVMHRMDICMEFCANPWVRV